MAALARIHIECSATRQLPLLPAHRLAEIYLIMTVFRRDSVYQRIQIASLPLRFGIPNRFLNARAFIRFRFVHGYP